VIGGFILREIQGSFLGVCCDKTFFRLYVSLFFIDFPFLFVFAFLNLRPDKRVQYRDAYCSDVSIDSEDEYKINKDDVYSSDSASISDADSIKHIRLAKHRKRNKRVRNANTKRNGKCHQLNFRDSLRSSYNELFQL
jgi:hypothetical protein